MLLARTRRLRLPSAAVRALRFWPVLVGLCVIVSAFLLWWDAQASQDQTVVAEAQRDATAEQAQTATAPLVELCGEPGAVGDALRTHPDNPCGLAAQVQAQPIPEVVAGPRGETGAAGAAGDRGLRGEKGDRGEPGLSPPCLSEPSQCRGADGRDGVDGQDGQNGQDGEDGADGRPGERGPEGPRGPAGGSCPEGESRQPYTWPDGAEGSRCVATTAAPPGPTPPTPPPEVPE